ncbi:MAG: hypothetical protein DDT26_01544 [Dehalococcoidia bacterium]|nr:hypothetical protein [Chloroflexota bacterium]
MECAQRDSFCLIAKHTADALLHLPRCLVGKGNRHDTMGTYVADFNKVSNAMNDNTGLAAPGAGNDQLRPFDAFHCCPLGRIETG